MRSKRQPVAASGNGSAPVQAILGLLAARTFATRCAPSVPQLFHPNRPKTPTLDAATMTPRATIATKNSIQAPSRRVFEDKAEIAEAHAAVEALRSLGRLERRCPASAGARLVEVESG